MAAWRKKFAQLLTEGIHRIRLREGKTVQVVQDELGYVLEREGGSAIEYWRKGHIPTNLAEVEILARELVRRGRLEQSWLEQFLRSADHPAPEVLRAELFPATMAVSNPARAPKADLAKTLPPFVAGPPLTHPAQFFGRQRELRRLFNLWKRPPLQNAALIGPRRSGKTSLLHYLRAITTAPSDQLRPGQQADWLPEPERYRWLFVDFQDPRLGQREGLMRYLLTSLDLSPPTPCDLDRFLDVFSQNLRQPTIILLDEIGVALQRYPELDDTFWESLRSLATNQVGGKLAFVLAAAEAPPQLARQSKLGSPFFNIFGYTATLGPLAEPEARALIASSPLPFSAEDGEWILGQSQGWPILLQILCRERLLTLEEGETGFAWREEGLRQMEAFRYLLQEGAGLTGFEP